MSIATEISRLIADRNTIRAKLVELGMATSTANLDNLAAAIEDIVDRGAVSVNVKEGETYTIPKGYHNGSGTVSGTSGGGNYNLQSKTATPSKEQQSITPDSGYYGLSDVTVSAIPDAYQDVSSTTAGAGDVLVGKVYVLADGTVTTGTMPNNGSVIKTLSATTITFTIPKGYHSGTGTVKIVLEEKTVTPTKTTQTITPSSGKVISKVTVNPIPDNYIDTTDADATAAEILDGKFAYVDGAKVEGTMPNNVSSTTTLSASKPIFYIPKGYHTGNGTVRISPETKTVTPTKETQIIAPYGSNVLSKVTVNPIPDEYITTTDADAIAAEILDGKFAYVDGEKIEGTMPNNRDVNALLTPALTNITIPKGYHSGYGQVGIIVETKSATPTKQIQVVKPAESHVMEQVIIEPIPDNYVDTTDADAVASELLAGKTAYVAGAKIEGTMENNGAVGGAIDGLTTTTVTIPAGYTTGGTVNLTGDIEERLAAI